MSITEIPFTTKFKLKPEFSITAFQVTKEFIEEGLKQRESKIVLLGDIQHLRFKGADDSCILIHSGKQGVYVGNTFIEEGDWIIKCEDGRIAGESDSWFSKYYEVEKP